MLRKGVYTYEYMSTWNGFNETSWPGKKEFYNSLNVKNITDGDYKYTKIVWKDFKIKNVGNYHDLYVQNDMLLLADVFESFRKKCIKTNELDTAHFLWAPGLENTENRIRITNWYWYVINDIKKH